MGETKIYDNIYFFMKATEEGVDNEGYEMDSTNNVNNAGKVDIDVS